MAYYSKQMLYPVHGARINTSSKWKGLFKDVTWDNIHKHFGGFQEYGNTLFVDALIIAFYFKCKFNLKQTAIKIGYKGSLTNPKIVSSTNFSDRLRRINTKSVIEIARELLRTKLITKQTIISILNKQVSNGKSHNIQITRSKFYLYYAKALVTSSIKKFGTRKKAAKKLGITLKTINYWVDLEVIDIRVKPEE